MIARSTPAGSQAIDQTKKARRDDEYRKAWRVAAPAILRSPASADHFASSAAICPYG
jgi:hypothetical protein